MTNFVFSKRDSLILKGIAMIFIIIHNYWNIGIHLENEFNFDSENIFNFYNNVIRAPFFLKLRSLSSFLFHYGVQIFIFLSGYGLYHSYVKNPKPFKFIYTRLQNNFYLMVFGLISFVVIRYFFINQTYNNKDLLWWFFGKATSLDNLTSFFPIQINSPWWFFGLIIQLYIITPILIKIVNKWSWTGFFTICVVCYFILYLNIYTDLISINLFRNAPAHIPEFTFGLIVAKQPLNFNNKWILLLIPSFILTQIYSFLFPYSFIIITLTFLSIYTAIKSYLPNFINIVLAFVGSISMIIFCIHGDMRDYGFMSLQYKPEYYLIVYIFTVILCSYILFKIYQKVID